MKDEEIDDVLTRAARSAHDPNPETLRRVADSIRPSLRPVRPLPPTWIIASGLLLVCSAVSMAGAAHAGFFGFEKMDLLERSLVFSVLAVLLWVSGAAFVHEMIPGSRRRLSAGALLAFASAVLLGVFAFLFRDYHVDHFVPVGLACLLTGLLYAVPAALLSWLLLWRGFALNPVSAGLAAGALGGLAGVAMLELHCPNFEAAHLLVWHTAVVPLSAALGALVAWILRFRRASGSR